MIYDGVEFDDPECEECERQIERAILRLKIKGQSHLVDAVSIGIDYCTVHGTKKDKIGYRREDREDNG